MEFVDTTHPFGTSWRKVMMWWFIVTDGLLFAGFLASYGYASGGYIADSVVTGQAYNICGGICMS